MGLSSWSIAFVIIILIFLINTLIRSPDKFRNNSLWDNCRRFIIGLVLVFISFAMFCSISE